MEDKIVSVDIGYSSIKTIVSDTNGDIEKFFKFPSVVGKIHINENMRNIGDSRVITFDDESYYVGEDALKLPTEDILEMITYEDHERLSPLFLHKVFQEIGFVPKNIVLGLSIAFISQSARYLKKLKHFEVNGIQYDLNIMLVPQGILGKLAVDKYGMNLLGKDSTYYDSYTFCDIGFNTIDVFRCISGEASLSLTDGIPGLGIISVVKDLQPIIQKNHNLDMSLDEVLEVLNNGYIRLRGKNIDVTSEIKTCIQVYIETLVKILEEKYGKIYQKDKYLILSGGGSYIFRKYGKTDDFIISPHSHNEYYNAVGYILYALKNPDKFSTGNIQTNNGVVSDNE